MIESTLKWSLLSGKPLEKWVASSGKLLIIGDAAHAMVPYMSEGEYFSEGLSDSNFPRRCNGGRGRGSFG